MVDHILHRNCNIGTTSLDKDVWFHIFFGRKSHQHSFGSQRSFASVSSMASFGHASSRCSLSFSCPSVVVEGTQQRNQRPSRQSTTASRVGVSLRSTCTPRRSSSSIYPLVMTHIAMENVKWTIEIDGLPINSMVIFHGYVSQNQRVHPIYMHIPCCAMLCRQAIVSKPIG